MKLIERIILTFFIVLFVNVETVGRSISKVNYGLFGNIFQKQVINVRMSKCDGDGSRDLSFWHPSQLNVKL